MKKQKKLEKDIYHIGPLYNKWQDFRGMNNENENNINFSGSSSELTVDYLKFKLDQTYNTIEETSIYFNIEETKVEYKIFKILESNKKGPELNYNYCIIDNRQQEKYEIIQNYNDKYSIKNNEIYKTLELDKTTKIIIPINFVNCVILLIDKFKFKYIKNVELEAGLYDIEILDEKVKIIKENNIEYETDQIINGNIITNNTINIINIDNLILRYLDENILISSDGTITNNIINSVILGNLLNTNNWSISFILLYIIDEILLDRSNGIKLSIENGKLKLFNYGLNKEIESKTKLNINDEYRITILSSLTKQEIWINDYLDNSIEDIIEIETTINNEIMIGDINDVRFYSSNLSKYDIMYIYNKKENINIFEIENNIPILNEKLKEFNLIDELIFNTNKIKPKIYIKYRSIYNDINISEIVSERNINDDIEITEKYNNEIDLLIENTFIDNDNLKIINSNININFKYNYINSSILYINNNHYYYESNIELFGNYSFNLLNNKLIEIDSNINIIDIANNNFNINLNSNENVLLLKYNKQIIEESELIINKGIVISKLGINNYSNINENTISNIEYNNYIELGLNYNKIYDNELNLNIDIINENGIIEINKPISNIELGLYDHLTNKFYYKSLLYIDNNLNINLCNLAKDINKNNLLFWYNDGIDKINNYNIIYSESNIEITDSVNFDNNYLLIESLDLSFKNFTILFELKFDEINNNFHVLSIDNLEFKVKYNEGYVSYELKINNKSYESELIYGNDKTKWNLFNIIIESNNNINVYRNFEKIIFNNNFNYLAINGDLIIGNKIMKIILK